jgi:hypothetical protein
VKENPVLASSIGETEEILRSVTAEREAASSLWRI